MTKIITALFLLFSASLSVAETITLNQDDILYIYDADTFFIRCDDCKKNKRGVRVMGVDSAEIRGRCLAEKTLARKAKQFAVGKIRDAETIELIPNPKRRYDRYKRLLAWVRFDGEDLASMLIEAGLGRPYLGNRRESWCD